MAGFRLFGFEFDFNKVSSNPQATQNTQPTGTAISPVPPDNRDGALNIQYGAGGGYYGYFLDLDGSAVDEFALINKYREMQIIAEVDEAIDQIINEMVIQDDARLPVSLDLDAVDNLDDKLKIRIQAEFDSLLKQMNFHKDAYSIVRQWYVDGRLFYHLVVDEDRPQDGIQELRIVDPRTIRKIREVTRKRHEETQMDIVEVQREYYVYNPMGFVTPNVNAGTIGTGSQLQYNGIRITADSIAYCPSGFYDSNKRTVLSWLHKAIKPLNLMRMMEDSCVIYRISRAPERRVFYIDVGSLPKGKAEQYLNELMLKYRNKLTYDLNTGDVKDDRKFMSILEDFWLPRREGGKGTEIQTLPAGQNLSEMEDVDYFRRKLYRALNLPPSRIDQGTGFSFGRSTEISRDEYRFIKFIHRLQHQFSTVFDVLLERQLRLKNIMTEQEWYRIKDNIQYKWQQDSQFEEFKNQEIWTQRMGLLTQMDPHIGRFFSERWISREILKLTDDQMATMREEMSDKPGGFGAEDGDGDNPFQTNIGGDKSDKGSPFEQGDESLDLDSAADEALADSADEDEEDDDLIGADLDAEDEDSDEDSDDEDDDDIDADLDDDGDEDVDDVKIAADKASEEDDEDDDKDKKKSKKPPFGKKSS